MTFTWHCWRLRQHSNVQLDFRIVIISFHFSERGSHRRITRRAYINRFPEVDELQITDVCSPTTVFSTLQFCLHFLSLFSHVFFFCENVTFTQHPTLSYRLITHWMYHPQINAYLGSPSILEYKISKPPPKDPLVFYFSTTCIIFEGLTCWNTVNPFLAKGHMGCFQLLVIINKAATDIHVWVYVL